LATEAAVHGNRNICLTNKVIVDVLACVPQLTTPTAAQTDLSGDFGAAALLHDLAGPARTPACIDAYSAASNRVAATRRHARQHGRTPCNLEREQGFPLRATIGAPPH
jgi:hypothetical protein